MEFGFHTKMEEYYIKFVELQEKLKKSEEERMELEIKFNEMLQIAKEEEQAYYRKLRSQYKRFLEEDKRRQDRNEKIMRNLERVEMRIAMLSAKTERLNMLRTQYQNYLWRISNTGRQKSTSDIKKSATPFCSTDFINSRQSHYVENPLSESTKIPDVKLTQYPNKENNLSNEETINILDKYLQNLSSQKCRDLLENERKAREDFSSFSIPEKLTTSSTNLDSHQATSIADDIMNSIYSRYYNKTDILPDKPALSEKKIGDNVGSIESNKFIREMNPENRKIEISETVRSDTKYGSGMNKTQHETTNVEVQRKTVGKDEPDAIEAKDHTSIEEVQPNKEEISKIITKDNMENIEICDLESANNFEISNIKMPPDQVEECQVQENRDVENTLPSPKLTVHFDLSEDNGIEAIEHVSSEKNKTPEKDSNEDISATPNELPEESNLNCKYEESELLVKSEELTDETPVELISEANPESAPQHQPLSLDTSEIHQPYQPERDSSELPNNLTNEIVNVQYDPNQNVENAAQENQTFQLDQNQEYQAQMPTQYDENGHPIEYDYSQYDQYGQPLLYDENGQLVEPQYDENGQLIPQYDENGQPIPLYDQNGQDVFGGMLQYDQNQQYDENGQPYYAENNANQEIPEYQPQYDVNSQGEYLNGAEQIPNQFDTTEQPKETSELGENNDQNDGQEQNETTEKIEQQEVPPTEAEIRNQVDEKPELLAAPESTTNNDDNKTVKGEEETKSSNVLEMLDTDTSESIKQNISKVSNDSDFDFT